MPFVKLNYHLVWAFKNREPCLTPELENRLFPFLVAQAHKLCCQVLALNGCEDHLHLVLTIPPAISVSSVVKSLKGASARGLGIHWQAGFGAFTIGEKALPVAIAYVSNQKSHHADKTAFRDLERWEEDPAHAMREGSGEYRIKNGDSGNGFLE